MELLIASGNPKKLVEIERFLSDTGVQVLSPADVGGIPDVVEDRPSFQENAAKKQEDKDFAEFWRIRNEEL